MEKTLFGIASKIATPLSLASLIVIALYLIYRTILGLDIFSTIEAEDTFTLLNNMLFLLFVLALAVCRREIIPYSGINLTATTTYSG